jgi:hypothetical protein
MFGYSFMSGRRLPGTELRIDGYTVSGHSVRLAQEIHENIYRSAGRNLMREVAMCESGK